MSVFPAITTGLAMFVSLAWVTISTVTPEIETDIVERVSVLTQNDDLQWVRAGATGQSVVLKGYVPSLHARARALTFARKTRGVAEVEDQLTVVGTSGACQHDIDRIVARERIQFASGSNDIDASSHFVLKMLAAVALNCDASIEISSHTDSRGDSNDNLRLSQSRADAVRRYLVRKGIANDQVIAKGYGETRPIYNSATQEGRLANQRIEFRVTPIRAT